MICAPCAAGADLTTKPGPHPEAVRTVALAQHTKCPGGTWCPCQHAVATLEEIRARRAARGQALATPVTAAAVSLEPAGACG